MWFEAALNNFWHFLENTKKQRSSCCWWGWWQHWSLSRQHMGRVHGWEHTNASLHEPCASPWLTKSMGSLKQESCHLQTRLTHQPLRDWERRALENSRSKLSGSYGGVNTFLGHRLSSTHKDGFDSLQRIWRIKIKEICQNGLLRRAVGCLLGVLV